jgi:hypothetical protein
LSVGLWAGSGIEVVLKSEKFMKHARILLGTVLALTLSTAALGKTSSVPLRDQQLVACADDMQRLCHGTMSDSKKLKFCIRPKRDVVSARCRAWLDVPH